ncbi:hypothetical protein Mgra_00007144 [Meloidogyne graminicola]|uniref:Transmembrane protein n=1 Tax=Meloidogyne graminicola TaxID=189291 RepID=A0A8S9ZJC5_9BILA|nr:hypothetical protein Mgra_00007144 [Meloidogyne graminicola]
MYVLMQRVQKISEYWFLVKKFSFDVSTFNRLTREYILSKDKEKGMCTVYLYLIWEFKKNIKYYMFSFLNSLKKLLIIIIIVIFILSYSNSTPENKQKPIILSNFKKNKINLKPWEIFSGYKITKLKREKRAVFTVTTILILLFWNITLGPFTQMQITSKLNLIGTFMQGGCMYRSIKNSFSNWCAPTEDEIIEQHFIQQIYMLIFENVTEDTDQHNLYNDVLFRIQLILYIYNQMIGIIQENSLFNINQKFSKKDQLFFFLLKNQLISNNKKKNIYGNFTKIIIN